MGSTTDSRHPTDWERQRAQLSALVDGELSRDERAELERHLPTCPECQEELARLRRVRALLGALPTPAVPRSFALPPGTPTTGTATGARQGSTRERADSDALYRASRWVGGIAASLGLALLLGSAVTGLLSSGRIESASTASAPFGGAQSSSPPHAITIGTIQPGAANTQTSTQTPLATLPPATPVQPEQDIGDTNGSLPLGPLAGVGLLASGVIVLVAGRAARPRDSA